MALVLSHCSQLEAKEKEGIRACTSLIKYEQMTDLESRLSAFKQNHPIS